jgi:phosphonate ABC transporter permease subunit PhnE
MVVAFFSVLSFFVSLLILANLMLISGTYLSTRLGSFSFLGKFLADSGFILDMLMVIVTALAGAYVLTGFGGRISKYLTNKAPKRIVKLSSVILSTVAIALILFLIFQGLDWIYRINNDLVTKWIPLGVGGLLGLAVGILVNPKEMLPIGTVIYYIFRTIFNALRSIESLIMVIVFVVWVGIGPFAGVLALGVHTIAALAKLYSEQVESILTGPVEAIKATGATRIQTIVYGVIPQIIPPYISFTMYRWDINVRMSTIIGFAGGGGIGFLLIQNINLLNYRAASVQMIAIALVVASMDYLSSRMRENVV